MSTTCRRRSAELKSSNVALNDSTNCVGKLEINPTVSENKICFSYRLLFFLVTESRVAKGLSAA